MEFRYLFLPYCLVRQEDGRYAVLNRRHEPLGYSTFDQVGHDKHAISIRITPAVAAKLSWKGDRDIERIYLYSGDAGIRSSEQSMAAYTKRLAILALLPIEPGDRQP